jgi:hypothetical protein
MNSEARQLTSPELLYSPKIVVANSTSLARTLSSMSCL